MRSSYSRAAARFKFEDIHRVLGLLGRDEAPVLDAPT